MTTSSKLALAEGTCVSGKWNKNKYEIVRLLGEGANGQVYLVRSGKAHYAMKIGSDSIDSQLEVNALRSLSRGSDNGPYLLDADDYTMHNRDYPFYVMNYVKGVHPSIFLQKNGMDWFELIHYDVLKQLVQLHRKGYIFGDLKADNVLVSEHGKIELIDFGGVTAKGRSVKQFTEVYDRGYWSAGSRKADEAYDLFAFAVLCLQLGDSRNRLTDFFRSLPQNRSLDDLVALIDDSDRCRRFKPFLLKALNGGYTSSRDAVQEWRTLMLRNGTSTGSRKRAIWIQAAFAVSLLLFASTLYFYLQS
ncbi:protein kinase domain-containing protein [Paenibacillus koleovorans]|uniref:protein kinase domain-containing protein n=1 Tax=Paenibacillus koleovorans TaxID=121608 RepID=UPI000FD879BB|nr:protein kinase [Paenibacillus koleovorans]